MTVEHYLKIYRTRLEMQDLKITNPPDEIKELTRTIVEKLSTLPLHEEIEVINNMMVDSKGNIIAIFPNSTIGK